MANGLFVLVPCAGFFRTSKPEALRMFSRYPFSSSGNAAFHGRHFQGPPAGLLPCWVFPFRWSYDTIGCFPCQRLFHSFWVFPSLSALCTNSPALFCATCTPCLPCQTPPALINQRHALYRIMPPVIIHAVFALSRVSEAVARFFGSGGILYYLTGGMQWRAVYAAIRGNGIKSEQLHWTKIKHVLYETFHATNISQADGQASPTKF